MTREEPDELDSAPLAYENSEFLNSPDGRLLRIIAEYQEPMARFRRERIQDTVVFFGSARFHAPDVANSELELPVKVTGTRSAYDLRLDFPHDTRAPPGPTSLAK